MEFKIPKSWEELSRRQFVDVACVLVNDLSEYARQTKLVWILSGLAPEEFIKADPQIVEKHFDSLKWTSEINFEKSFIPEAGQYSGPGNALENFCFNRFVFAEAYFQQYKTTNLSEDLDKLLGVLYIDEKFSRENVEKTFSRFTRAEQDFRKAAFVNYFGLRNYFADQYPAVFSLKEETESTSALDPWDRLVDDLAGPKFGKRSEVGENNVHDIFIHLQNLEEKRIESEKK